MIYQYVVRDTTSTSRADWKSFKQWRGAKGVQPSVFFTDSLGLAPEVVLRVTIAGSWRPIEASLQRTMTESLNVSAIPNLSLASKQVRAEILPVFFENYGVISRRIERPWFARGTGIEEAMLPHVRHLVMYAWPYFVVISLGVYKEEDVPFGRPNALPECTGFVQGKKVSVKLVWSHGAKPIPNFTHPVQKQRLQRDPNGHIQLGQVGGRVKDITTIYFYAYELLQSFNVYFDQRDLRALRANDIQGLWTICRRFSDRVLSLHLTAIMSTR